MNHRRYMLSDEICDSYLISSRTLYRWIAKNDFPIYTKIGISYVFIRSDVTNWFKNNRPSLGRPINK